MAANSEMLGHLGPRYIDPDDVVIDRLLAVVANCNTAVSQVQCEHRKDELGKMVYCPRCYIERVTAEMLMLYGDPRFKDNADTKPKPMPLETKSPR